MKEKTVFTRIYEYICKDTGRKNESSKLIVVIRLLALSMAVYSLTNSFLIAFTAHVGGLIFSVLSLVLFIFVFVCSYYWSSFTSYVILNIFTLVWTIANVIYFGWNIGVQHFIVTLLVFCYFSKYKHEAAKIIYTICLLVLRIYLYYYCNSNEARFVLEPGLGDMMQIVNTVFVFWSLALTAYIFSTDSQELEGKLIEYNKQLMKQANTDTLTGLHNRRSTLEYLDTLLHKPEKQISICMCDIDFFKRVNDTYGHDVGDVVLKKVSHTFLKELPPDSFISRWGGEEFLLIFPKMNGDEAAVVLGTLRQKIKGIVFDGGIESFSISLTYGLVEYDYHSDMDTILKEADEKLYIGKESGRDRIIF